MSSENDQDVPLTGDPLLREIAWTLDRNGIEIVERQATAWLLRGRTGRECSLVIENLVRSLGRSRKLAHQRRMLQEIVPHLFGDSGGASGTISRS